MKRITIELSPDSCARAIDELKQYQKDIKPKLDEVCRRLAQVGVETARQHLVLANGNVDAAIEEPVKIENGYKIVMSGADVYFIEFGTGVRHPEWDNTGMDYTPPKHGTYGKGQGKNPSGWWFKQNDGGRARHTYGNPPAEAMLTARNEIIDRAIQIAREVWRNA